ncbi:uncharacterized protein LOC130277731 isoform X2 [Hyla sarda]|nr:uncharacterized protein LOC130277731 isoform X2 [Hyla sarda]
MPSCVVRGCVCTWKKRDPSIILHCFPKEPERIKVWLQQTGQYDTDIDKMVEKVYLGKVYDSYRMCSLHFTHDNYHYDGYRRILKKDAVPTIFIKKSPAREPSNSLLSESGPPSSSSEQHIHSSAPAEDQKLSGFVKVQEYLAEVPDVHSYSKVSQTTIQQVTLVPVVPQHVFFEAGTISHKSNSIVTFQSVVPTTSEATQNHSALSDVSQQSSALRPSTSSILKVPSSPSCVQQNTSTISQIAASSDNEQLEQVTPANLQQISSAPITFLQKSYTGVAKNSSLPLAIQLRPDTTSLSTKMPPSTTSSCPIISSTPAPSPIISTSPIDKSSYNTMTTPPSSIALAIVRETKPYSTKVFPVSENVCSVTQMPPTTSSSAQKPPPMSVVHFPFKTPTSQTVIPDCLPPSKKRKLEEMAYLEPSAASSSGPSVSHSYSVSQTSVNTGKLYFVANSTPLGQPSCLKPLMVDKGVNTDFFTNKKSCCVSTDHWHLRRNAHTQTKINTKHRKIMCTLIVPSNPIYDSNSNISDVSPEDIKFNVPSPPRRSDNDNDLCEDLETVNLNLVKVEILSDSEMDASLATDSDVKQAFYIKGENVSSAGQAIPLKSTSPIPDLYISSMKVEPNVKTEDDQFSTSSFSQDISQLVSQNPKIERILPITCEQFAQFYRNQAPLETSSIQTDDEPEDSNVSSFYINELSEDEDESFLVPSDAEEEDDVKYVFEDLDSPVENLVEEEKYIVFESCLKKLIMMIPCRSETKCMSPLTQYRKETVGSYLSVEARCSSGHTSLLWESQPRHGYEPLGNVLLSAAVLFSGSSFVKSQHMFKLLNLKSVDKTTYSRNQSMYLFPTISHHWKEEQKAVIQSVLERPLSLAGDQQLDNPGFSANYSTYSLIDVGSKKICSISVEPVTPQVTLEGLENIGFQKSMGELQTMNADVKMIVTGRSIAIQEMLKDSYPGIIHQIDLWHLSRSIGNEVLMAAKHKDCEILYQWVEAIRNHLWWSFSTCCKNPDLLIQKWKSVIHHVTNIHEWDGDGDCRACHHPPLPEEVVNNTNWLEKGSAAHEQLKNIVESSSLLKDLKQLSFHCHTGELDIYNRTCLKYRPKSLHFFKDSMVARTQLAALDYNRNVLTVKEVVRNASNRDALGSMTQRLEDSKGEKSWIMKALYKPTCQKFLFDIMNHVIALVKEEKTFQ